MRSGSSYPVRCVEDLPAFQHHDRQCHSRPFSSGDRTAYPVVHASWTWRWRRYVNAVSGPCRTGTGALVYRLAMERLKAWRDSPRRKPLILQGARQVGKTWLALEFGRTCYDRVAHVVFLDNEPMRQAFEGSLSPQRLLPLISAQTGVPVEDGRALVVFDEVQEFSGLLRPSSCFRNSGPTSPSSRRVPCWASPCTEVCHSPWARWTI